MNVLVISDHGLTDTSLTSNVLLDDYIDLDDVQYVIYSSGYATIVPFALQHEKVTFLKVIFLKTILLMHTFI
jgi:hypothetical protein